MVATQGTEALVAQLADEIIKRLRPSYDLVYVDYRDRLMDEQVDKLVRGDDDWLDASWDFESDQRYESAKQIIDDLAKEVIDEWEHEGSDDLDLAFVLDAFENGDDWDRVRYEIEERDKGNWPRELAAGNGTVLLRVNVLDEDSAYSYEDVTARRVLKDIGLRATKANVEAVNYVLANASPEFSVLLGYWIVGADVVDIYEMPYDTEEVEIVNPYLYLGNPFTGSGFISEQALEGTVRVKREDLRTDRDAFGYAVDEIYGGLMASQFECEIRPVKKED